MMVGFSVVPEKACKHTTSRRGEHVEQIGLAEVELKGEWQAG